MKQRGFTLIELAIVLVIIGLITGSVLVGRDLVSAAGVRAQIAQIEKYQTAVNTFRGKYGYLPGDIPDPAATQYGFAARGTAPGQGDGNGVIEGSDGSTGQGNLQGQGEIPVFWMDLSASTLISGRFNAASATSNPTIAVNQIGIDDWMPQSKMGQSSHVYVWSGGLYASCPCTSVGGKNGKNYFGVSQVIGITTGGITTIRRGIPPEEAYSVDAKIDDGLPNVGRVTAMHGGSGVPMFSPTALGNESAASAAALVALVKSSSTCYDNGNVAGQVRTYSVSNVGTPNCSVAFEF